MPNFDTGHLFLTFLAPIRRGATEDLTGANVSFEQRLRTTLGLIPTALQSPATIEIGENSPFARNRMTHLCRFMVLEDTIFNGRDPSNAILNSVRGRDPITPGKVDRLGTAFLLFAADIDAVITEGDPLPAELEPTGQAAARDAWARKLWETMEPELRMIFDNCYGFDKVSDAAGFARYLARCQVETTMPFNDYWISPPDLPRLPVAALAAAVVVPLVVALLGLAGWIFGMSRVPLLGLLVGWPPGVTFLCGLVVTAIAIFGALQFIDMRGRKPMPPARYGDLPSVLKSLYLQQNFSDFVVEHQASDAQALHAAFGDFLKQHRPEDKLAPSQAPGVISIKADGGVIS